MQNIIAEFIRSHGLLDKRLLDALVKMLNKKKTTHHSAKLRNNNNKLLNEPNTWRHLFYSKLVHNTEFETGRI